MEKIKKTSESQLRAGQKYDSKMAYRIGVKLNIKTDSTLIKWFEENAEKEGKQGYIKRLIREDIARRDKQQAD